MRLEVVLKNFKKKNSKTIKIILKLIFIFCFISYLCTVLQVSLFKNVKINEIFSPDRFYIRDINLIPFSAWNINRLDMKRDIILNLILYFPFGFLLQMINKRNRLNYLTILLPFLLSITLEALQYFFSLGVTDIMDVLSNTIGALIGALCYLLFNIIFKKKKEKANFILLIIIFVIALINILL